MDIALQEFATQILLYALTLIVPVVGTLLAGLIIRGITYVRSRLTSNQWELFTSVIGSVVAIAEQSGLSGQISAEGTAKKQFAINLARERLTQLGLTRFAENTNLIASEIEAAVLLQFNLHHPAILEAIEGTAELKLPVAE